MKFSAKSNNYRHFRKKLNLLVRKYTIFCRYLKTFIIFAVEIRQTNFFFKLTTLL